MKPEIINFKNFQVKIYYKNIRNLNLKVALNGEIKLSVPKRISQKIIKDFLTDKEKWIEEALDKFSESIKFHNLKIEDGEIFYHLGVPKKFKIIHSSQTIPEITASKDTIEIKINSYLAHKTKERYLNKFLEKTLIEETKVMFEKWESKLCAFKSNLLVKNMKGKWGYCNVRTKEIFLNTELAKRNLDFIEYVVLHEICHLIVPNHGPKFKQLLNIHMPYWKQIKSDID